MLLAGLGIGSVLSNGPTMYEIRLIMQSLGCTSGLCLDGSDMTRITYMQNDLLEGFENSGGSRNAMSRIRLTDKAATSVIWGF